MQDNIKAYIAHLEQEKGIEVLLACETGSRAWGFPSPDSDFDVRMIYKHPTHWYLSLVEGKDTIDCFFEQNEIDISGWDIRKSLRLLRKSNAPLLERIQSPIIYKADEHFLTEIHALAQKNYSRIASIHHYLHLGKKALQDVKDNEPYSLKRFFYALRAAVSCVWILEKEIMPPITFRTMLEQLDLPAHLVQRIQDLIVLKSTVGESYLHTGEPDLITWMENSLQNAAQQAKHLPTSKGKMSDLNDFFRKIVQA